MNWVNYLLQTNLYLLCFYALYKLAFSRETYFNLNRAYLVGFTLISFSIPFWQSGVMQSWFITQKISQTIYTSGLDEVIIYNAPVIKSQPFFDRMDWFILFYLLGVLYMSVLFCINLIKAQLFVSTKNTSGLASSFFGKINIDKQLPHQEVIISHELAHGRQVHSFDLMVISIVKIICWFNPVVYLLHIEFKKIHEFIADSEAAIHLGSKKAYAEILVSNQFRTNANSLLHNFYDKATVKTRLIMLSRKKSPRKAMFKYGLIAPACIAMLILASSFVPSNGEKLADMPLPPLSFSAILSNEATRSGVVKDSNGQPLPGARVKVKGTNLATNTDVNGSFSFDQLSEDAILQVSFVGFEPIEIVAGKKIPEISLSPASFKMAEVVVTALSTSRESGNPISTNDTSIDQNPEFPGGTYGLYQFIAKNLKYPTLAQSNKIQGMVMVNFTIDENGNTSNPVILQGIGSGCDEEVIRIIKLMPKWQAAKQNGKNVATNFQIPVSFMIEPPKPIISMPNAITSAKREGEVFTAVEQQPKFPGGIPKMYNYIGEHLIYPTEAVEKKVEGRVFLKFVVTKFGDVDNIEILKGIGAGCDEAAIEVIRNMPRWQPGFQGGQAVNVYFTMPVQFKLSNKKHTSQQTTREIKNATILQGKVASQKYGDRAQNGAMVIELNDSNSFKSKIAEKNFVYVLDGKIVTHAAIENLNIDQIKSITVLKNADAKKQYPNAGEKDVLEIVLK